MDLIRILGDFDVEYNFPSVGETDMVIELRNKDKEELDSIIDYIIEYAGEKDLRTKVYNTGVFYQRFDGKWYVGTIILNFR